MEDSKTDKLTLQVRYANGIALSNSQLDQNGLKESLLAFVGHTDRGGRVTRADPLFGANYKADIKNSKGETVGVCTADIPSVISSNAKFECKDINEPLETSVSVSRPRRSHDTVQTGSR